MTLVLVTKDVPSEKIQEAFEAGARDFGENRVQELFEKKSQLSSEIRWHFVGRLQTNKVKSLLGEVVLLHSLDRMGLAHELEKQAEKRNRTVEALLQVNTTGEATKAGFPPEALDQAMEDLRRFSRIRISGLMTIGPPPASFLEEQIRLCFRQLRTFRDQLRKKFPDLNLPQLSMGMSQDFEIAVEEGSTIVRIGTAVFGERKIL